MRLRRDDFVMVLSGNFRGQGPAKIVSIDADNGTAQVDGIGRALKHVKRGHPKSPQGGRVTIPVPIQISKIALHCPKCSRGVRAKFTMVDGLKCRICGRCHQAL